MLKYKIIKNGIETNSWTSEFADETYYEPCFGLPERWVESDVEIEDALDSRVVIIREARDEVRDDQDVVIEEAIEEISRTEYLIAAEYSLVIEDITAKVEQSRINIEARHYLAATDWMIIREMEGGAECSQEVKDLRAAARASIVD